MIALTDPKKKILQQSQVGEVVVSVLVNLVLPSQTQDKWGELISKRW